MKRSSDHVTTANNSSFARTVSSSDSIRSVDDDVDSDSSTDDDNNSSSRFETTTATKDTDADPTHSTTSSNNQELTEWEALQDENARLRSQVADLTSALLVRDMEIASLHERCQLLLSSVDQQDAVIAKIYAATASDAPVPSSAIAIPASRATESLHAHVRRHPPIGSLTPTAAARVPMHVRQSKAFESIRRFPGTSSSATEPARELLEAHLDSIGYEQQSADDALASLSDGAVLAQRAPSASDDVESVGMLDRLLFPSPRKTESLFGSSDATQTSSITSSKSVRSSVASPDAHVRRAHLHQSPPLFGRSVSDGGDFAKSAGFLRKANRKLSGRLTVSDFGLLSDDTALFSADDPAQLSSSSLSSSSSSSTTSSAQPEDANETDSSAPGDCRRTDRRTASQRNLFAEIDDVATRKADALRKRSTRATTTDESEKDENASTLSYAEFLERISLPASRDILNSIRTFIGSVLGPRGDGKPPRASDYVDYDFYGHHEFARRYEQFFDAIDATLARHPAWRHASEATLLQARDGVEKYVMDKLSDIAFNQLAPCQAWKQDDEKLFQRMKLLSVRRLAASLGL